MLNKLKVKGFNTKVTTSTNIEQSGNNVELGMHKTNYFPK